MAISSLAQARESWPRRSGNGRLQPQLILGCDATLVSKFAADVYRAKREVQLCTNQDKEDFVKL